ncbi:MAG: patatin-like phospholipase family protein [Streptosporangiaceae bacterium]
MTKALVLSGGGAVGIAWEIGVAAGLARGGIDVRDADFIVGTSAGSAVGAQLALGRDFEGLVSRQRRTDRTSAPEGSGSSAGGPNAEQMQQLFAVIAQAMAGDGPAEARRAAIGRFALTADALPEDQFVAAFRYLKDEPWPAQFACPAVDALSGEVAVWDIRAGVELDRAVASSCAVPGLFAPITINGRRYLDGGFRSGTNADLASGHDRVLIITLLGAVAAAGGQDARFSPAAQLESETAALTKSGTVVQVIAADEAGARAIGVNLMDRAAIPAAVDEGIRQGESEARRLRELWSGS